MATTQLGLGLRSSELGGWKRLLGARPTMISHRRDDYVCYHWTGLDWTGLLRQ